LIEITRKPSLFLKIIFQTFV